MTIENGDKMEKMKKTKQQDAVVRYLSGYEGARTDKERYGWAWTDDNLSEHLRLGGSNKHWIDGYSDCLEGNEMKYSFEDALASGAIG